MTKTNEEMVIAAIERVIDGASFKEALAAEGVPENAYHTWWVTPDKRLCDGLTWARELDHLIDQIDRKLKGVDLAKAGVKPGSADLKRVRQIIAGRIIRHGEGV